MARDTNNPLEVYLSQGTEELRRFIGTKVIQGNQYEIDRVTRYYLFWKFYDGEHYKDFNDNMLAFNYVKAFIDKVNIFLLGDSCFSFQVTNFMNDVVDETLETNVEKLMLYNYRKNKYHLLIHELLQMGSVCGNAWMAYSWNDEGKYVEMTLLDSRQCFPIFKNGNIKQLEKFTVRQVLENNPNKYTMLVTEYTSTKMTTWYQKSSKETTDKDTTERFEVKPFDHNLGFIPVVNFKNRPQSSGYFAKSDAHDILKLNKVYNEMNQEMKAVIDYHSTPTTVITGASAKSLKRTLGGIWSGLPPEANVFNLGLDFSLSEVSQYLDRLKVAMHEISDVPENVLGKTQAISGTSAAALKLTYQPLVQQADQKALTYGEGIVEANTIILKMIEKYDPKNKLFKGLPKDFVNDYRIEPVWSYGFPTDRMQQLQEIQIEDQLKLGSRKEFMNRLGKNNVTDLMSEIETQRLEDAELEAQIGEITLNSGGSEDEENTVDAENRVTKPVSTKQPNPAK